LDTTEPIARAIGGVALNGADRASDRTGERGEGTWPVAFIVGSCAGAWESDGACAVRSDRSRDRLCLRALRDEIAGAFSGVGVPSG